MKDVEFWRLETVEQKVGLSKSEIYRRMRLGEFPESRAYPGGKGKMRFWISTEVRRWQRTIVGDAVFDALIG
jgi:predicted DNA-binding transcriptional regulator AlpA